MPATDDGRERAMILVIAALFGGVALLATIDLLADLRGGTTIGHVALEGAAAAVSLLGVGWMMMRVRALARETIDLREHARELATHLDATRTEVVRWRSEARELIAGLSAAIDRQLTGWGLSPAEKEVALLLLKGLSHKEIATVRDVGETTVRQQARAIYRKAGLGGRHDLAAFFLEDLLGPPAP